MRIIDPQSATLTNIEVLAHLAANPPRRPPNPPPNNPRSWVPSPDLRDHNTVVKEIHNYAARLSPHLLKYPSASTAEAARPARTASTTAPLDAALRELVARLKPFALMKGEVLMIANLGVGLGHLSVADGRAEAVEGTEPDGEDRGRDGSGAVDATYGEGGEDEQEGEEAEEEEEEEDGAGQQQQEQREGDNEIGDEAEGEGEGDVDVDVDVQDEDYGALALLDTVIEEREERLSDADVVQILAIVRETLGGRPRGRRRSKGQA